MPENLQMLEDRLREALNTFDGNNISSLGETEARFWHAPGYAEALISLCQDPEDRFQTGASWLLKSHLEHGGSLHPDQVSDLVDQLGKTTAWAACLHLCQLIRHVDLSPAEAKNLARWAMTLCEHDRPFVRAWALDALCYAAETSPDLLPIARDQLAKSDADPKASVKARARNLRKAMNLAN